MKKTYKIMAFAAAVSLTACNLDLYSPTSFNKGNVETIGDDEASASQYKSRTDMENLRNTLYNSWVKDIQEMGLEDWLVYSETRADNAYCGTTTAAIMALEANKQDGSNGTARRDWKWYQGQVSNANQIICNIDRIAESDPTLRDTERDQWKAEALIWRSFCFFRLTLLWGDAPMVLEIPPTITVENIEEVYSLYYPDRTPMKDVYAQLVKDLTWAVQYAPKSNANNKMLMSDAFAYGLLARIYAEKPIRDWSKVIEYCNIIEGMGFSLEPRYGDLWGYDANDAFRNSRESIFEVQWTSRASGNWVYMMYHRNAYKPEDNFSWAKWQTPSRDLIKAFEDEEDTERMNASIIWDKCTWSNYYESDEYAFMHKMPTNVSSILVMRLAEIYLLHAEACACTGDFEGVRHYVNLVRRRAKLGEIAAPKSVDEAIDVVLHERRLELAFEGFRFFDLARHDRIIAVHDSMNAKDPYWQKRTPLTESRILLPVPTEALDANPSMSQNPGY